MFPTQNGPKKGIKKEPRRVAWLKLTLSVYHLAAWVVQVTKSPRRGVEVMATQVG